MNEHQKSEHQKNFKRRLTASVVILGTALILIAFPTVERVAAQETSQTQAVRTVSPEQAQVSSFGLVAAAIAFGLGALGAGIAIGSVGAAAMGAVAEKPEIAGQALIFIALAEGLVVFGFITALLILGRI